MINQPDKSIDEMDFNELHSYHMALKNRTIKGLDDATRKKTMQKVRRAKRNIQRGNTPAPAKKKSPKKSSGDSSTKKRKPSGPGAQKPRTQHIRKTQLRTNETTHLHPLVNKIPESIFEELGELGLRDEYDRSRGYSQGQPILLEQKGWSTNLNLVINEDEPITTVLEKFRSKWGWDAEWFTTYFQGTGEGRRHYLVLGPVSDEYRSSTIS